MKSLFTSVPVEEAMKSVKKILEAEASLQERSGYTKETVMSFEVLLKNKSFFSHEVSIEKHEGRKTFR